MSSIIWAAAAILFGSILLSSVAHAVMRRTPGPAISEPVPSTDLQRASRWSLGLAVLPAVVAVAVIAAVGLEDALSDPALRITLSVLAVASLTAAGAGAWWVARREKDTASGVILDERDRAILERAPAVQSIATILALAAWTVILTERFWNSGGVPLAFLQLVFWSCLLINLLGLPVGVLIGYRKS